MDWPAVALSVSLDAADIESILAEYPEPPCTEDDDDGDDDDGDDDLACPICDAGDICRMAFETDAGDVADEADAPLVEVMRWMHENDLHSNKQSISIMADRFNAERAARILIRRAQTPTA